MRLQRVLAAFLLLLFILTFVPAAIYIDGDNGSPQYVGFYRQIAVVGFIELPISGLFTLIAFLFAIGVDRWRLLTSGVWALVAGLWALCALLLRYRVPEEVCPLTYCINAGQIAVGLVSILLGAFKKRWNQEGKPVR